MCARTTARMYLTLEYSRHPLSPGVAGMEEGGGRGGSKGEGGRERERKKRRKELFLHNRKHGVARINGFFD